MGQEKKGTEKHGQEETRGYYNQRRTTYKTMCFYQICHLNQGSLEEGHREVTNMGNQLVISTKNPKCMPKRSMLQEVSTVSLMMNFLHKREEWKKMHVAELKFLHLKKTELTRNQTTLTLESILQTFSPRPLQGLSLHRCRSC